MAKNANNGALRQVGKRERSKPAAGGAALAERPQGPGGGARRGPVSLGPVSAAAVSIDWSSNKGENLARRYGMDEHSVAQRRQFIRLGAAERELLSEMAPWAQSVAPEIAKDFYDWQFEEFFENFARENNLPVSSVRPRLEATQAAYLIQVFAGASVDWDLRYFEKRLEVGATHDRINLPFKWAFPETSPARWRGSSSSSWSSSRR